MRLLLIAEFISVPHSCQFQLVPCLWLYSGIQIATVNLTGCVISLHIRSSLFRNLWSVTIDLTSIHNILDLLSLQLKNSNCTVFRHCLVLGMWRESKSSPQLRESLASKVLPSLRVATKAILLRQYGCQEALQILVGRMHSQCIPLLISALTSKELCTDLHQVRDS